MICSRKKGSTATKSTQFMRFCKNSHLDGDVMNRSSSSTVKHTTATTSHTTHAFSHVSQFESVTKLCPCTENALQFSSLSKQKVIVDVVMISRENCAYQKAAREKEGDSKVIHIRCFSGMRECGVSTGYSISARLLRAVTPALSGDALRAAVPCELRSKDDMCSGVAMALTDCSDSEVGALGEPLPPMRDRTALEAFGALLLGERSSQQSFWPP